MSNHISPISALIIKYLEGNGLSSTEQAELDSWLDKSPDNRALFNQLNDPAYVREQLEALDGYDEVAGWKKIMDETMPPRRTLFKKWQYWAAAAVLAIVAGTAVYQYNSKTEPNTAIASTQSNDITAPTTSKATIRLHDGTTVAIDSLKKEQPASQGNIRIEKNNQSGITYVADSAVVATQLLYNTLTNPRGSTVVQLTLSDGSRVWLNADSEIRYPVSFGSADRLIELKGEGYFEVAKSGNPFLVKTTSTLVKVTGTHFNVNAYIDEPTTTVTLLEGGVTVSAGDQSVHVSPGQQAQVGDKIAVNKTPDVEQVMAWKNGYFSFKGEDIYTTMRQLSRWYDVVVTFKEPVIERFHGDISREENISEVLKKLETTGGIHFTTTGKQIEVRK